MKNISLIVSDDESTATEMLCEYFSMRQGFEVLGVAADGEQALEMTRRLKPDVLVLDILMPKLDGLGVLERLGDGERPKTIVTSSWGNQLTIHTALAYGANFYLIKPFLPSELEKRIKLLFSDVGEVVKKDRKARISELLFSLRATPKVAGFNYMVEAINIILESEQHLLLSKNIYPEIACKYGTESYCVEIAIRKLIEKIHASGDEKYFEFIRRRSGKPSNGEFLRTAAERIKMSEYDQQ